MTYIKFTDWVLFVALALIISACGQSEEAVTRGDDLIIRDSMVCYSLFAEPLKYPTETRRSFEKKDSLLKLTKANYDADSRDLDNIIWYGRRLGYLSEYPRAMSVYTRGLHLHPSSPEIYRHRGHRYISMRRFEEAVSDLQKAAELAAGRDIEIEQDGIPNKLNKPLSSLQLNIWYHIGLAFYLQGDYKSASIAYDSCMVYSINDDLLCATSEWYYLTALRLGDIEKAKALLEPISKGMEIVENDAYRDLLLLYKGYKTVDETLPTLEEKHQYATIGYGVANYLLSQGDTVESLVIIDNILATDAWASFGYIAAEADKASGRL